MRRGENICSFKSPAVVLFGTGVFSASVISTLDSSFLDIISKSSALNEPMASVEELCIFCCSG